MLFSLEFVLLTGTLYTALGKFCIPKSSISELCPDRCSRCSDFKILIKQKFDARTSYDKDNERHPTLATQLVKRSNLRLGWRVLDLACGSGLVTYLAAADVGSAGFVTGMDLSTGLLEQVSSIQVQ